MGHPGLGLTVTDPRTSLAEALGETMDKKWWLARIAASTKTNSSYHRVTCPNCRKRFDEPCKTESLDMKQVAMLLDQGMGRPAETKKVTVDITARTLGELDELTDAELAELAAAEDGEWELLPSPEG